jgi:hypothetical protein
MLSPEEIDRLESIPLPDAIREFVAIKKEARESRNRLRSMRSGLQGQSGRDKAVYALLRERLYREMGLVALEVDGTAFRATADRRGIEMIPVAERPPCPDPNPTRGEV